MQVTWMTRRQRLALHAAAGLLSGLVIALVVVYGGSRTEFGMERARRLAVGWLAARVDGTVEVGRITGRGLLGGVTIHDLAIVDNRGQPFARIDSLVLAYNWRTFLRGEIIVDRAIVYGADLFFEQLPGDSIWNYQRVFPDRTKPGEAARKNRLIMLRNVRIVDGSAVVRMPFEGKASDAASYTIDTVSVGLLRRMRFDSVYAEASRVLWESPIEDGKLIDIRSLRGRGYVWRDAMHVERARGTLVLRDSLVAFDMPDIRMAASRASMVGRVILQQGNNFFDVRVDSRQFAFSDMDWLYPRFPNSGGGSGVLRIQSQRPKGVLWLVTDARLVAPGTRVAGSFGVVTGADSLFFTNVDLRASPLNLQLVQQMVPRKLPLDGLLVGTVEVNSN